MMYKLRKATKIELRVNNAIRAISNFNRTENITSGTISSSYEPALVKRGNIECRGRYNRGNEKQFK